MDTSKTKKFLSSVLAVVMLFTMIPTSIFTSYASESFPVMMQFTAASGNDFHRYYKQVYSVTFLDEIDNDAIAGAVESWDISANTGSGEVMSWMYLNEEATAQAGQNMYDVYIAGEGGVGANPQSGYIFYMFEGLKEINNPENFKTGTATTFYNTFYGCFSLEEVDFSSWDVSNVNTIKYMFYRCYGLKYANLSGWNTSNITNMHGVFEMTPPNATVTPDYSLKKVDLTGWDTSNVTTMENMFKNCEALTELDLSSFDTSKVTTMRFMFYYCKALKNIYVGEGWTTESIKNINDGIFNCCYALVGGTEDQEENIRIYNDKHPSAYYPPSVEYAKTKEENGYLTDVSHKPEPEKKEFKVTYEFTGNIPEGVTAPAESIYEEGATADIINVAPVDGYTFSGWTTEDTTVTDNSFTVSNDIHFVGSWTKLYKVEYIYADGYPIPEGAPELPQPKYYTADEWVDVFGVPYVDRHVFIGWTTEDADITGDMFMMPENDVVLYGYYKIPVESIEIMADENITINEENQIKINVYVNPEDATIKDIIYESSDESIITVDKYGNITAVGEGTAEITVYSKDDPTKNDTVTVTVKVPVTDITVDRNEITLREDGTEKITVTVTPDSATDKKITYESSDETVVKVDENGNITAVGAGEATVTVSSADNPSVKEEIKVTVKNPVTEITVPSVSINVYVDDITDIKAKVNEDATNKELIYESSNPGVAKVDKDGNVTAVSEGEAIITVTSKDDPSKTETVKITVKPKKVPVEDITSDREDITLTEGETDKINITVTPDGATDKSVTYKSSDETIVKIDENGNIEAVGEGEAIITVTSKDDPSKTETVKITVKPKKVPVEDITSDREDITLTEGETDKINITVTPDGATDKSVTYKSSDETVVKVDENGNIEAVGEGEAIITVTSKDDPSKTETVKITVKPKKVPVEDITSDREDITLTEGETDKINVTVTPDNATDKSLIYVSSDETIVKVDENGNIEAVNTGTATVTVLSKDDPSKFVTVEITVDPKKIPVENVTADKTSINLTEGDTDKINVTVTPDNATDKSLIYVSSNETVVKVDENGNIEAVNTGTATVTVLSKDDPTKFVTVEITVTKAETEPEDVPVNDVLVDKPVIKLIKGEKDKITATVTPDNATNKDVTYKSLNPDVVTVDENGNITAVGAGTASILVISKDDPTKVKTVTVTVTVPVSNVTTDKKEIELTVGNRDKITVTVTPDDASEKGVTYKSSDETIVKVDEKGNIEAVGEGTATVTVTSKDDPSKKVTVTVTVKNAPIPEEPEKPEYTIEVPEAITLFKGEKKPIGIVITPDDGEIVPIYKSSDESVVKIDADGNITAMGVGAAIITVDFGGGDIRLIPVTVLTVPVKHHVCFGKTDGIGWYEVSVNGGDFFPQGPNSTLEVAEGSVLVVRVQDMWIDDEFDFYVNGKKVPLDPANTITVIVDGYMLIGALSMDVPVPDAEESVSILQKILNGIKDFFSMIKSFFENLFS